MDETALQQASTARGRAASGVIREVVTDTRGAIFLLGIGLGLVLLGVAWNVSSLGAAALWRERASDVADAAAFETAVWHARGMNLLVVSNLLMAVFMALFTFWRMLVTVLTGLSYLCSWPIFPPCALVQSLEAQVTRLDGRIASNVSVLLRSLTSTERALASLMPVVPMARTPAAVLARYPEAQAVQTFSQALLPSKTGPGMGLGNTASAGQAPFDGGTSGALQQRLGQRLGQGVSLPVQADDFDVLCSRSVEAEAWLARRLLPFDVGRFGPWWQAMTGGDAGFFCLNDAFPSDLRQAVRTGLIVTCAASEEPATCLQRRLARFRPTPLAGSPRTEAPRTAKVWELFENGGPFASVFAVAEMPRPLLAANDRGLVMPDPPGHASLRALSSTGHVASQAEYYFDCTGKWSECRDDAAWRLWYRARLRPLRADPASLAPQLPSEWAAVFQDVLSRYGGTAWQRAVAPEPRVTSGPSPARSRVHE
jgi:hypothetical protein